MADLGELRVRIGVAVAEFRRRMAQAQNEVRGFAKKTERQMARLQKKIAIVARKMGRSLGQAFSRAAVVMVGAMALTGKKAVQFASDAQESMNLFRIVMGENADASTAWSEQLATDLGLNATQIRKYLSTFQLLIEGQDIATDQALLFSKAMTQLTFDLASFRLTTGTADDAFQKLTSGLVGMSRPLQNVGIDVRETAVSIEALRVGIIETDREMTVVEKTMARVSLLLRRTEVDQGDLIRTAGDFKNALERLGSSFVTAGEAFGTGFLDPLATGFDSLGKTLRDNEQAFKDYGVGVGIVMTKLGIVFTIWQIIVQEVLKGLADDIAKVHLALTNLKARSPRTTDPTQDPHEIDAEINRPIAPGGEARRRIGFLPTEEMLAKIKELNAATKKAAEESGKAIDENADKLRRSTEVYDAAQVEVEDQSKKTTKGLLKTGKVFQQFVDSVGTSFQQISEVATDAMFTISDSLTDLALTGKADFKSMAESITRDITQMIIRMQLLKALFAIFPSLTPASEANQAAFVSDKPPVIQHSGGIVGQTARRMTFPAMGPRLHQGLARDEFPAILQRGETVTPAGAESKVQLNIQSPDPIEGEVTNVQSTIDGIVISALIRLKRRRDPRAAGF